MWSWKNRYRFWIFEVWIEYSKCIELRRIISEKIKIFQQYIRARESFHQFFFCLFQMGRLWRPMCCIAVKDVQWLRHGPKKFYESGRLVPWVATNQQQTWLQTKGRYRRQSCLSLNQSEITTGWLTIFWTLFDKTRKKRFPIVPASLEYYVLCFLASQLLSFSASQLLAS